MRYADAKCKIVRVDNDYVITGKDVFTGDSVRVVVPGPELFAYRQGVNIADAMPSVGVNEREFLISGMYDSFPDEEECQEEC